MKALNSRTGFVREAEEAGRLARPSGFRQEYFSVDFFMEGRTCKFVAAPAGFVER